MPWGARLRRYFLVGLIVIAPVGLTVFILRLIFDTIDDILGSPLRAALGFRIPGLGFVLLALVVLVVGWIVHQAVGRRVLHWWNLALSRFPLTGRIYNAVSQIVQNMVGGRRRLFRRAVLVPFPTDGLWSVGFVTREDSPVLETLIGEPCLNVFLVTTPNPTTGFLIVVPRSKTKEVDLSIEDALKFVISAGTVPPSETVTTAPRKGLDLDRLLTDDRESSA